MMKHITILVTAKAILGSLEGSRQMFTQVNEFLREKGEPPLFKVQLVGCTRKIKLVNGLYTINCDRVINEVKNTDLIIIPALEGEMQNALRLNRRLIPWILTHYRNGAEVASLCMGAFLLAATGLLKGKRCATHWMAANEFRRMFPDVKLVTENIITDEQGIYSSGGAFSYQNLILYLIDKYAGHEMAVLSAKIFAIEIERMSQSSFIIFKGQKEHEDWPIRKAQEFIETNFRRRIRVDDLAGMFYLSRRNFERRFKKATANTVNEYIQRVKIEAAKMNLESSQENVNEIMYKVGYSDPKAFRTTFKKITGLSPSQYRHKYNRRVMA
jgi:transcriptional regulator GlxA family with amidase domain